MGSRIFWRRVGASSAATVAAGVGTYAGTFPNGSLWLWLLLALASALLFLDACVRESRPFVDAEAYAMLEGAHAALGFEKTVRMCLYKRKFWNRTMVRQVTKYATIAVYGSGRKGFPDSKGIVGLCFRMGKVVSECVESGEEFEKRMMRKWGFDKADLNDMQRDRRAYLCVPVLDTDETAKAVIYVDALTPNQIHAPKVDDVLLEVGVRLAAFV